MNDRGIRFALRSLIEMSPLAVVGIVCCILLVIGWGRLTRGAWWASCAFFLLPISAAITIYARGTIGSRMIDIDAILDNITLLKSVDLITFTLQAFAHGLLLVSIVIGCHRDR